MKKTCGNKNNKYKTFKKPKLEYILDKTLVLFYTFYKRDSKDENVFKEE